MVVGKKTSLYGLPMDPLLIPSLLGGVTTMVVVVVGPFGVVVVDDEDIVEAVVTTSSGVVDFVGAGVVIWTENLQ